MQQAEIVLENELIAQLETQGYGRVAIANSAELQANLKRQLEVFNNTSFSSGEFERILIHLDKGNVFAKSATLRGRYQLTRDNGDTSYIRFFNNEDWQSNLYQVTNQVTMTGRRKNRYDVTILVNGLPLVQIELKRRGIELKEAFNQVNRYQRHSFWADSGLFNYVQIFVISNGVNTKYYANNRRQSFKELSFWTDEKNTLYRALDQFTEVFLDRDHLGKMIARYIVRNETHKVMMVLRPYQYYAVEALIRRVRENSGNGYIWHTTGSGKTLTSFKASQIIMEQPGIHKVVFVVDRKDLDYQTITEFNRFKKNSVDMLASTRTLLNQLKGDSRLIVTTIQKLNRAVTRHRNHATMKALRDQRIVFIFDECHRSQFGDTHRNITGYFSKKQLFGFTGTPIFVDNAYKDTRGKHTTHELFHECLHRYVITNAIRDEKVLPFSIEYIGRYKKSSKTYIDIDVEAIDTAEAFRDEVRLSKIADYIIRYHDYKTHRREFTAIFAVSSIENLIRYYDILKVRKAAGEHDLRIATIFSYGANEPEEEADGTYPGIDAGVSERRLAFKSTYSRDKLEEFVGDYNTMYGTGFSIDDSKQYDFYYKDISKRIKKREEKGFDEKDRVDILLVVSMFLTGFDAKKVNTIYVDKNLQQHGLIQAFSRTNRIIGEKKSHGNVMCFRNLKKATDDAIALFSNVDAKEVILLPPYEDIVRRFSFAFIDLLQIAPTPEDAHRLADEEQELKFVQAFRKLLRLHNVLTSFTEFDWADLTMPETAFLDYKSRYVDLWAKVRRDQIKEKASILDDVDFEVELIHRDEVNVTYILKLLAKLKEATGEEAVLTKAAIMQTISGEVELRSKQKLIEQFIDENLPKITNVDQIPAEFDKFWTEQKQLALNALCHEEHLDHERFQKVIDEFVYTEQVPLRDTVVNCLDEQPSVLKLKEIGDRIIDRLLLLVDVFVKGIA